LSKLKHRFELRTALITAVALLIAQFGAMAHGYTHDSGIERNSAHLSDTSSHEICGDCLNFAPLLSAAGAPAALPYIAPQGRGAPLRTAARSLLARRPLLAFRSRAPPASH
jgi:hypothetical protein